MPLIPGILDQSLAVDDYNWLNSVRGHALQNMGGCVQTYCLSRVVLQRDVPGDFVECGCASGAQLAIMAKAMLKEKKQRIIHAFDSFQGIPHAGPKDDQQAGLNYFPMDRNLPLRERLVSTKVASVSLADAQSLWNTWKFTGTKILWHEGWFQDTLPGLPQAECNPIAFLRLDGDLHESTECCLEHLYDRVSPEGLLFIDDYGLGGCRIAVTEFMEKRGLTHDLLFDSDGNSGAAYWFK